MSADFVHRFAPGRLAAAVLLLHGTGGDENDLVPIGRALASGAALLSPRMPAPGSVAELVGELADWIDWATKQYSLDPSRIYALGHSNGADLAAALMLLHPGAITGALLFRPVATIRPNPLPKLNGAPVLISAGAKDPVVSPASAEDLGRLLSEAGARVDLAIQNADHELVPADFSVGKQWFARLLV